MCYISPSISNRRKRSTQLLTGLTAQWKLNEASGVFVDSRNSYNLTAVNSPGTAAGKINTCRTFDGTSYASRTAAAALMPLSSDFSFSTWFYMGSTIGTRQIFGLRNAGSLDGDLHWILRGEGSAIKLYVGQGSGDLFSSTTVIGSFSTSTWYHFACSVKFSTKEVRYRVDGGAATSFTSTYVPTVSPATPKILIGGEVLELLASGSRVDCTKLWAGTLLTDALLLSDYNSGVGIEL